jgi:hypothetical protein
MIFLGSRFYSAGSKWRPCSEAPSLFITIQNAMGSLISNLLPSHKISREVLYA